MDWLNNFHFDLISFLLGFLAASVFWLVFNFTRKLLSRLREPIRRQTEVIREGNIAGINKYLRQNVLLTAQKMHISNSLFSLDEILVPPKLLVSPLITEPRQEEMSTHTITSQLIPYLPDWTELSANFNVPTITLAESLQAGVNIAVTGQPGSGKTVALAHLASLIARRDRSVKRLVDFFPLILHVLDITFTQTKESDLLQEIIKPVYDGTSSLFRPQLSGFIHTMVRNGNFLLLLDGLDELPPPQLDIALEFLSSLIKQYPKIRIVITLSPQYIDGAVKTGFYPMAIAGWNHENLQEFIRKWAKVWSENISPEINDRLKYQDIDARMMIKWLGSTNNILTPLQWTLKIWAAFAGDVRGPSTIQAIESYLQRVTHSMVPHIAMEKLAFELITKAQPALSYGAVEKFLSKLKLSSSSSSQPDVKPITDEISDSEQIPKRQKKQKTISSGARILNVFIEGGLFLEHAQDKVLFVSPIISGYLASFIASQSETPDLEYFLKWCVKDVMLSYTAAQSKTITWAEESLKDDSQLYRNQLGIARWLSDLPAGIEWRPQIMRRLVSLMQRESLPIGIRAAFLSALIASNDVQLPALFKQLMTSRSPVLRQLAIYGSGAIRDTKLIDDLTKLLTDPEINVRLAACLALVAFNTSSANGKVLEILNNGDEDWRRAVAEALAGRSPEGYEILRQAIKSEDLLTRRAAIFGLMQIREEWVISILEKLAVEDNQWVVRNAAGQAIEILQSPNIHVPRNLPSPNEAPWVLSFAAKHGMGVSPSIFPSDILLLALSSDTLDECLTALNYLRQVPEEEVMKPIMELVYTRQDPLFASACLYALWFFASSGIKLTMPPHLAPTQI